MDQRNSSFRRESSTIGKKYDVMESGNDPVMEGLNKPQFTFKACFVGVIIGSFNCVIAMYYGFKTGLVPSLNVLAGVGGFVIMKALMSFLFKGSTFTPQENVVVQTCAVGTYSMAFAGGFSSSLLGCTPNVVDIMNGYGPSDSQEIDWIHAFIFCAAVSMFGIFISLPLREYMIVKQKLIFPSGTATATMIETLHHDPKEVKDQVNVLSKSLIGGLCYNFVTWFFEGSHEIPIFGMKAHDHNYIWEITPTNLALPLMLSHRVIISTFLGGVLQQSIIKPWANGHSGEDDDDWFTPEQTGLDGLQAYYYMPAIAIVIADGVYNLVKVIGAVTMSFRKKAVENEETGENEKQKMLDDIFINSKIPHYVWIGGLLAFGIFSIVLLSIFYDVEVLHMIVFNLCIPILAVGIIQGCGLTDFNLASTMGKLLIFVAGAWSSEQKVVPILIICQATIAGCSQATDLMQDFRTGYLVGASPKAMMFAQLVGAAISTFVAPSVWVLFDAAYEIPGDDLTAPFGEVYRGMAVLGLEGFDALPPKVVTIMLISFIGTIILNGLNEFTDDSKHKWQAIIPLPFGIALGLFLGPTSGMSFFIFTCFCILYEIYNPDAYKKYRYLIAAGMLAADGILTMYSIFMSLIGYDPPVKVEFSSND